MKWLLSVALFSALLAVALSNGSALASRSLKDKAKGLQNDANERADQMGNGEGQSAMTDQAMKADVAKESNQFGLDLYNLLRKGKDNIFISPISLSTALTMTANGASGDTLEQMAKTLHLDPKLDKANEGFSLLMRDLNDPGKDAKKRPYQLSIANALWGQKGYGFKAEFLAELNRHYGAGLTELDYVSDAEAARGTINKWVEDQTNQKIKDLIAKGLISDETRLVLTNAVYFKGLWETPFKKAMTADSDFTGVDGKKTKVKMMHRETQLSYMEEKGFQAIELPYVGKRLGMVVLLPRDADGLEQLQEQMTVDKLKGWLSAMHRTNVDVYIPRFKMTCEYSLLGPLKTLGMRDAFEDNADFSRMTGHRDLHISAVVHKAFVEVNEEGTEAAAATGVIMAPTAAPEPAPPPPVFRADHPFLFLIRDTQSGAILFLGRVNQVQAE